MAITSRDTSQEAGATYSTRMQGYHPSNTRRQKETKTDLPECDPEGGNES